MAVLVLCSAVQYSTIHNSTIWIAVQCSSVQFSLVHSTTVQCSVVHYSVVGCSAVVGRATRKGKGHGWNEAINSGYNGRCQKKSS